MLAADESFSEYSSDSTSPPCDLSTLERLLRTHPVWFLPDIQRAGAVHLLQSKEHGVSDDASGDAALWFEELLLFCEVCTSNVLFWYWFVCFGFRLSCTQSFVVRGSSQTNTMAVSVRLPPGTGPYIEHYLIQSHLGELSLETSKFKFDSIPALIAHYSQCW